MNSARKKRNPKRTDRFFAVLALIVIVLSWFIGRFRAEADLVPFLKEALPKAGHFEAVSGDTYKAWLGPDKSHLIGYVAVDSSHGYGGNLTMAVAVSEEGKIIGQAVVKHRETTAFFNRVLRSGLIESMAGKSYEESFELGKDVDAVTGATYSSRALTEAARKASRKVAAKNLGYPVPPEPVSKIRWGIAETVLVGLFFLGWIVRFHRFKFKKAVCWLSMLTGIFVIGFIFNKPLTLVLINKALLGFWPDWRLDLYWYILLFGILFFFVVDNKNPYCEWFCPFGSTQECVALIGGTKKKFSGKIRILLRWFQRILALGAIVFALVYRNPSVSSYEVFGAFFRLIGTNFHFVLLGIVLIASLFLFRPWCHYLCPLRPVTDFIRLIRNWIREIWLKLR